MHGPMRYSERASGARLDLGGAALESPLLMLLLRDGRTAAS